MEDPGGRGTWVLVLVCLILAGLFLSLCEFAFRFASEGKIKKQAEEGDGRAALADQLLSPGSRLNVTLEAGKMLCWLFSAVCVLFAFLLPLKNALGLLLPWPGSLRTVLSSLLLMLALAFLLLVFTRLLPKRIAAREPDKLVLALSPMVRVLRALCAPFGFLISGVSALLAKLFGFTVREPNEGVTEEEIMLMVDAGQEKGVLEESQKEMISNIFEFEDLTAEDIMTHRTDILGIDINASLEEAVRIAVSEGYSRIPVYEEDIDSIVGILYSKDLLKLLVRKPVNEFHIKDYMRPALYVPESNRCGDLFKTFTATRTQMAVVVDEYGGTSGIVTMEDLLEEIVGNIQDEYDDDEEEIIPIGEGAYVIDGLTGLDDVADLLHVTFEEEDEDECDTLGGFIIYKIGRIPTRGDRVVICEKGYRFTVLSVKDRRILKVRVEKLPEEKKEAQEQ